MDALPLIEEMTSLTADVLTSTSFGGEFAAKKFDYLVNGKVQKKNVGFIFSDL